MKLYNTLTRKVETLTPLNPPGVTVYTCGPTVYDYAHIGHWFTYIRWDILIRTLQASGFKSMWVMNITDVGHLVSDADEGEDKLEKGARREGKTAWEVAEFYTADFLHEMAALNIQTPTHITKATEHLPDQIDLIKKLEAKGFTYIIDDGVYYDTSKFPHYADFARLDVEEQQAGARVEYNSQKRNPTDFALWKFSPKDQKRDMEWESPWGTGFPGWHIECSAMSMKYLGETLDIHTGGIDHIPVHHTNEIAQSEAVTGKPFARMWLHSNHVLINGEKISKSLGNSIRLKDIEARGISLEAFRLHVLESHYRSQSKFSWDSLKAAQNRLKRFKNFASLRYQLLSRGSYSDKPAPKIPTLHPDTLVQALRSDLNTPQVLAALEQCIDQVEKVGPWISRETLESFLQAADTLLGLQLMATADITPEQKAILIKREEARSKGDWTASDTLRGSLEAEGLGVRDTAYGAIWYRL